MTSPIKIDSQIQGGAPCFAGTRVPVVSLFDLLEQGYSIDEFLLDFPTVKRQQVVDVLDLARRDVPRYAEARAG